MVSFLSLLVTWHKQQLVDCISFVCVDLAAALHQLLTLFSRHSSPFLLVKFKQMCNIFGLVLLHLEFNHRVACGKCTYIYI